METPAASSARSVKLMTCRSIGINIMHVASLTHLTQQQSNMNMGLHIRFGILFHLLSVRAILTCLDGKLFAEPF